MAFFDCASIFVSGNAALEPDESTVLKSMPFGGGVGEKVIEPSLSIQRYSVSANTVGLQRSKIVHIKSRFIVQRRFAIESTK